MRTRGAPTSFLVALVLGWALTSGCRQAAGPPEPPAPYVGVAQSILEDYVAGNCSLVERRAAPEQIASWPADENRHATTLLRGFCFEQRGDREGARAIYQALVDEAPGSFSGEDARERLRYLDRAQEDPEWERWVLDAAKRADPRAKTRTPIERVPAEFPPLAHASNVEGYTVVEFGVTPDGETRSPIVVDSSPPYLFDGASIRAVRGWQFMSEPGSDEGHRQVIRLLFAPEPTAAAAVAGSSAR